MRVSTLFADNELDILRWAVLSEVAVNTEDDVRMCEGCGVREATRGCLCEECNEAERQARKAGVLEVGDE